MDIVFTDNLNKSVKRVYTCKKCGKRRPLTENWRTVCPKCK